MALSGKLYANSAHAVTIAATNAYAVARSHNVTNLGEVYGPNGPRLQNYIIRTIYIKLDTLAGLSATPTLTVRLTRDANGNDTMVGDTTASISLGVTTATEGAITIAVNFAYGHNDVSGLLDDNLFCFWKLDQGTGNVRLIEVLTEA
jgi:hypothetical protein